MLYVLVCFLGFAAAGILGAFTAQDWFSVVDFSVSQSVENLRNSVAATSVSSFKDNTTAFDYNARCVIQLAKLDPLGNSNPLGI